MALVDIIRNVIPRTARQKVGLAVMEQASRSKLALYPYLWLMHGLWPKGLHLDGEHITYFYRGHPILAPRNGVGIFLEIFQDEVYDRVLKPREGDVVIDVGAYVGMFTVKTSFAAGQGGKVVAVEPETMNYAYLRQNCSVLDNAILVPKALSDHRGVGKLYLTNVPGAQSLIHRRGEFIMVELETLDHLVEELGLERVDFIKVDAEGAELEVLAGAERTLEGNGGLKLAIASYHISPRGEPEQPKVVAFLEERGFKVITERGLRGYTYAEKS